MENKKRLIDANEAIERAKASDKIVGSSIWETGEVVEFLEDCPIVDAVEVVHGRWKLCDGCGHICSICGFWVALRSLNNYCPHCGANMRGSEE